MGQYFPKPYEPFDGDINVRADLSNYGTKADLENATEIDTSKVAEKFDLVSLNWSRLVRYWQINTCSCWFK